MNNPDDFNFKLVGTRNQNGYLLFHPAHAKRQKMKRANDKYDISWEEDAIKITR